MDSAYEDSDHGDNSDTVTGGSGVSEMPRHNRTPRALDQVERLRPQSSPNDSDSAGPSALDEHSRGPLNHSGATFPPQEVYAAHSTTPQPPRTPLTTNAVGLTTPQSRNCSTSISNSRSSEHIQPLVHLGIHETLQQLLEILALKRYAKTSDAEPLTDETISLVIHYRHGLPEPPNVEYLHGVLTTDKEKDVHKRAVWGKLTEKSLYWGRHARKIYWEWMEMMRNVWIG